MTGKRQVGIVDDDPGVSDSLSLLLQSEGLETRTYASAEAFLAEGLGPDTGCVLADIRMPGMDGLALLSAIAERRIDLPVIVMTGYGDVPMAVSAMKKGAADFIQKPIDAAVLLPLIRQAMAAADSKPSRDPDLLNRLAKLTERERGVFDLLIEGHPNKVVAYQLSISPRTVEIHRARVMEKLGLRNIAELIKLGLALRPHE